MKTVIPIELKKKCCELKSSGMHPSQIYREVYVPANGNTMNLSAFRGCLNRWMQKKYPDNLTLDAGTYEGFTAHGATVQVNANGEIVQSWIKQTVNPVDPEEFIAAIVEKVEPYECKPRYTDISENMLEIPLFDMHWGITFMDHYSSTLDAIIKVINSHRWRKIVIPFGQDFFHNDSIVNGQTTKGTNIEKVDMQRAVKEGQRFVYALINAAIDKADEVKVVYSPGNHDRSISWMFMQVLLARYGSDIVDDTMEFRRVFSYGKNAIMITHGDSKNATAKNLAHIFPVSFPQEFAGATTREVHSGHLHHESDYDIFGVMVRRLSSGNVTDEWSNSEDFIGVHKRFMLFDWSLEKLSAIYYI